MNLERIDLSENLIHFVSGADMDSEDYYLSEMHPKEFALGGDLVEESKLSPFFVLRRIVRKLQILSTWSYRNGQRTIYGEFPAVCFTEMPLSEFVKTSIDRESKGQKISNYGFVFNKKELFTIGARPVIYGTSKDVTVDNKSKEKFIKPEVFARNEIYRFVSFKLDRLPHPIDWTHEREWRWPNFNYKYYPIDELEITPNNYTELQELYDKRETDKIEFHGLNINKEELKNIGIILKSKEQARLILRDILWLIDSNKIHCNTFGYILFFDKLKHNIDKLTNKNFVKTEINNGLIRLSYFLSTDENRVIKIENQINQLNNKYKDWDKTEIQPTGMVGISFPSIHDNRNITIRILVQLKLIIFTKSGGYLINLPILNKTPFLESNEKFVRTRINPELESILGIKLTYYSIGNTQARMFNREIEINDVPFWTEPNDDEWNYGNNEFDY